MRHRLFGGPLLVAALLAGGGPARAQVSDYSIPSSPEYNVPIPTGNPGTHGFYTFLEFMYLTQTRAVGEQLVAVRGLVDATGNVAGVPGALIGTGTPALSTRDFPRGGYQPGFNIGAGYKLDDGTSVYVSYLTQLERHYHAGATAVAPGPFRTDLALADSFLTAGVFNFPPQYAGQLNETNFGAGNFYGIWNGAGVMDIQLDQRFTQWEIGARFPLFQTEYSRIYGMAGGRFDWFFERFKWRTVSFDVNGVSTPFDAATYSNTLSQRMYGPFIGCGHEVYIGKAASISLDLSAAGLINLAKERAKYRLDSRTIQNKLSRDEWTLTPNVNANLNVWWYPLQGVQVRAGYNAWTFFNTLYMDEPIGFNYSSLDPAYSTKVFRIVHGLNFGLSFFF